MQTPALPLPPEEWALPAGLASDGARWLSLREVAEGAREAPWAELAVVDRARLLAARAGQGGPQPPAWRSAAEVAWLALGFLRAAALGRLEPPPPAPPALAPPQASVVRAEARWDPFSRAAGQWRRQHLDIRLPQVRRVEGERLSRATLAAAFLSAPSSPMGRVLSLAGHGRADRCFGDAFETLLSADPHRPRLPAELRGWTVHLLACHCARCLGPALIAAGCAGFVGYADDFLFDPDAPEIFFAADARIVLALAAGADPMTAAAQSRAFAACEAWRLRQRGEFHQAAALAFNASHLRAI
ncbi:MAG: hypothetical protein JSR82_02200 [Verrucomicrobia bacterium]|nr:hypothetical protein [Verrucomicrobiota bacterium]